MARPLNAVLAGVATLLAAAVAITLARRSGDDRAQARPPAGAKRGEWQPWCDQDGRRETIFRIGREDRCRNREAGRAIEVDEVWCRWSGANVLVHMRLVNAYDRPTVLEITPRYVTASGQHGTFSGSHSVLRLMPGEIATVELVAGTPRGDAVGEPITACTPRLEDAYVREPRRDQPADDRAGHRLRGAVRVLLVLCGATTRAEPPPGERVVGSFVKSQRAMTASCSRPPAAAIVLTLGLAALVRSCRRSAARGVKGGGVSCRWRGSNVFVHVVVRNRSRVDRIRARVGPRVSVDGVRSTSMENDVELTLAPDDRIVVDLVADGLDGLKLGAPITRCSVRLVSAFAAPGGG